MFHSALTKIREELLLPDGGKLGLDWFEEATFPDDAPLLLFLPGEYKLSFLGLTYQGLTGDSNASYIRHIILGGLKIGWRCVVMNYRGTNGVPLEVDRIFRFLISFQNHIVYSAGWTTDLRFVARHVRNCHPDSLIVGVGFSLGSNILVRSFSFRC